MKTISIVPVLSLLHDPQKSHPEYDPKLQDLLKSAKKLHTRDLSESLRSSWNVSESATASC